MLKNILCACALSSMITWTAFANEDVRDTLNPSTQAVVIEKEETQEPKSVSDKGSEVTTNLIAAAAEDEEPVVIPEEKEQNEILACEEEEQDEEVPALICCEDEEMAPKLDDLQQHLEFACEKCGNGNGKHRVLAVDDQQDESEKTTLKTIKKEEVKAA